jgi:hypothetical protein
MRTAFLQQHSVLLLLEGEMILTEGNEKNNLASEFGRAMMSFNSRISVFVELQKAPQPLPSDTSRTFDECDDHAAASPRDDLTFPGNMTGMP